MFVTRPVRLLTAISLLGAIEACAPLQTVNFNDGWSVNGAIAGSDSVYTQPGSGNAQTLIIEKKSPYQANRFLHVFKPIPMTGLRGTTVRMTYDIETTVTDSRAPGEAHPPRAILTRIECDWRGTALNLYTTATTAIDTAAKTMRSASSEFTLPDDMHRCTINFAITTPMLISIKNLKFEEATVFNSKQPALAPLPAANASHPPLNITLPPVAR